MPVRETQSLLNPLRPDQTTGTKIRHRGSSLVSLFKAFWSLNIIYTKSFLYKLN